MARRCPARGERLANREAGESPACYSIMKLINNTTWEEVFERWREREASNPNWIHCATKIKGWPDWESWRKNVASQIDANKREWKVYQFTDPINEIPEMLIGPFSSWQSAFSKKNTATFYDLLDVQSEIERFSKHEGVLQILAGLPFTTDFIGLIRDDDKIVCLDGHHRATAFALVKRQGRQIDFGEAKITISLAHLGASEVHIIDEILKHGSSKSV